MIRTLIADDSPVARELLRGILADDPDFEIVGMAHDGSQAVAKTLELKPDIISMDIQMPVMDGFEATAAIMSQHPTPIVITSSSDRIRDIDMGMKALEAGALTLVAKPAGPQAFDFEHSAKRLRDTLRTMSQVKVVRRRNSHETSHTLAAATDVVFKSESPRENPKSPESHRRDPVWIPECISIVTSTGGPSAMSKILAPLSARFPIPIFVVQHIIPGFTDGFIRWLDSTVALDVCMAERDDRVLPGKVYVAPDNQHLDVTRSRISLSDGPLIEGFRPSGTHLFHSMARTIGRGSLGILLTGMGRDGVDGLRAVRDAGGRTICQDEESSVVFGMPAVAINEGLADDIMNPVTISKYLLHLEYRSLQDARIEA